MGVGTFRGQALMLTGEARMLFIYHLCVFEVALGVLVGTWGRWLWHCL